jgi:hypothetical protein
VYNTKVETLDPYPGTRAFQPRFCLMRREGPLMAAGGVDYAA